MASADYPEPGERVFVVDNGLVVESESEDGLSAEFRHQLGLLPEEEEGLTEAFKVRIGLLGSESEQINEIPEVEIQWDEEREETLAAYKFTDFARNNFSSEQTAEFCKDAIKKPLLRKHKEVDHMASLAVWQAIQRFMTDAPCPNPPEVRERTPVMTKIYKTIESRLHRGQSGHAADTDPAHDKTEYMPLKIQKRSSWKKIFSRSTSREEEDGKARRSSSCEERTDPHDFGTHIPSNDLDLIHFIVGHGILRKEIRTEIYCQLCRQVTNNPRLESCRRGWMLHALCAGCFLPSDQFVPFYRSFLKDVSPSFADYARYTRHMLRRSSTNGLRYHPPNWLEYQATVLKKFVMLPISLPNGTVETLEADPATTAAEIVQKVAENVGLKETFGFSLYICIRTKVSSLGSGKDHVMDAISECEQLARAHGQTEEDAPWRLLLRKELFTPWYNPETDWTATELIYRQLCRGVHAGEYKMKAEDDLARFVAKWWYVDHGPQIVPGQLQSTLHDYLPERVLLGGRSRDGWTQAILASFHSLGLADKTVEPRQVILHTVVNAPRKWPLQFSGLFEAFKLSGPSLLRNVVVVGVSSRGFFVTDDSQQLSLSLRYYEIVEISSSRATKSRGQTFTLITVKGEEFTFVSPNSQTICKLVSTFLDGLRRRSKWAVGLQEYTVQDHVKTSSTFGFGRGDVIELLGETEEGHVNRKEGYLYGRVEGAGGAGAVPLDCVYVLPTSERPPDDFLDMFRMMAANDVTTLPRKRGKVVISKGTIGRHDGHGLQTAA